MQDKNYNVPCNDKAINCFNAALFWLNSISDEDFKGKFSQIYNSIIGYKPYPNENTEIKAPLRYLQDFIKFKETGLTDFPLPMLGLGIIIRIQAFLCLISCLPISPLVIILAF